MRSQVSSKILLVGGFNPFEKYYSKGIISPNRGENKHFLKPPPSLHPKTLVLDVLVLVLCIMVFSVLIQDVDVVDVYVDDVVDVAVPCDLVLFLRGFLAMKKITTTWSISNIAIFNRGQKNAQKSTIHSHQV